MPNLDVLFYFFLDLFVTSLLGYFLLINDIGLIKTFLYNLDMMYYYDTYCSMGHLS